MTTRLYIGKRELSDLGDDVEAWLVDKIPPPPPGTMCEDDRHDEDCYERDEGLEESLRALATTYLYRIEDGHVCYTYVCDECGERADPEYLADQEYPTTKDGYAVTPRHCA